MTAKLADRLNAALDAIFDELIAIVALHELRPR